MDNSFLNWLKSAVIFGIVFGLSACDKLNSPKSTNTAAEEQPTQSQSIEQENTSKTESNFADSGVLLILLLLSLGLCVILNKKTYCAIYMKA